MARKKEEWIPQGYYKPVMFAKSLIENDNLSFQKAVEISTNYYRKKVPDLESDKVASYLTDKLAETKPEETEKDSRRTFSYWIVQKTTTHEKGTVYGKSRILKATSKKNASIQCTKLDWEEVGSLAYEHGFFMEYRVVAGPYTTREEATTVLKMCE